MSKVKTAPDGATTYRSRIGRFDVARDSAHYIHVHTTTGAPMLMPCPDGGYPVVYYDPNSGDVLCARCATVEMLTGCGAFSWGGDRFAACVWTQRGTPARRSPVFRRWSRRLTKGTPRRLATWGRAVLTLPLVPSVLWEGPAETCANCSRRIRSAYAVSERPRGRKVIRRADVDAFYPGARMRA